MLAVLGIVVGVAFGLAVLGVRSRRRRRLDPLLRRSRALTALTRIAETTSGQDVMLAYPAESIGNVRLIERRHERQSRAQSRRRTRVARDETVLNRPTIAVLPTPLTPEPHHGKPKA